MSDDRTDAPADATEFELVLRASVVVDDVVAARASLLTVVDLTRDGEHVGAVVDSGHSDIPTLAGSVIARALADLFDGEGMSGIRVRSLAYHSEPKFELPEGQ